MSVPTQTSSVRNHDQDRKGCSNNHDPRFAPRPIILITGATGGVGFGICLRLLHQLSQPWQPDLSNDHLGQNTHDEDERAVDVQSVYATPNGLTLLIACRCEARCKEAIAQLRERLAQLFVKENNHHQEQTLHSYIDRQTAQVETLSFPAYRQQWLANLRIESVAMDLYRAQTVLEAIKTITARHGYLSHLLLNAGGGPFVGLDWLALLRALMHNFLDAVTYPDYVLEAPTVCETEDRLTETWQLNLFSHYLLAKHALPLLQQASISGPGSKARIVWTASLDGRRTFFDRSDYQSYHPHRHAYQSSKYQVEIVGQAFHATIQEAGLAEQVTSIVAHPGIVAGNMFRPILGWAMDFLMRCTFYVARLLFGSPHHLIDAYSAALVWSCVCLGASAAEHIVTENSPPVRYGARCDRWGNPRVVKEEETNQEEVTERRTDQRIVVEACERRIVALSKLWDIDQP